MVADPPTERIGRDDIPDMVRSYERYLSSGLYDRRYPQANRRTLGMLLRHLPPAGRFLDFGAGTGRYSEPLLRLTDAGGVAYDICPTGGRIMTERMDGFVRDGRLAIRNGPWDSLSGEFPAAFDLVFLAFGVLGHIRGRENRRAMLSVLRRTLKPDGVLIAGLPNSARRFRTERRAARRRIADGRLEELEEGDVLYRRGGAADAIPMFYHLFTPEEAHREFAAAGFRVDLLRAESLLAEEKVVSTPLVGWLDDLVCRFLPAICGFGFLVVARPRTPRAA